jgi:hypothetical protein
MMPLAHADSELFPHWSATRTGMIRAFQLTPEMPYPSFADAAAMPAHAVP